jgi:hypothetical protein
MIKSESLPGLPDFLRKMLYHQLLPVCNVSDGPTHIVSQRFVDHAMLVYWPGEEGHDIVHVRVIGFERNVVVPRFYISARCIQRQVGPKPLTQPLLLVSSDSERQGRLHSPYATLGTLSS